MVFKDCEDSGDDGADGDGKVFEGIYYHFYSSDCIDSNSNSNSNINSCQKFQKVAISCKKLPKVVNSCQQLQ